MRPHYAEINGVKFKIDTDFKTAVECDRVLRDPNIGSHEKTLAIIYLIFGDAGLERSDIYQELLDKALIYLTCGKGFKENKDEPDMDLIQDMDYIEASFMLDYKIDLENSDMHYWKFNKLLCGLSEDTILNRVRYTRNIDISEIKDPKYKKKVLEQQKAVKLNNNIKKSITFEQQKNMDAFFDTIERE